MNLYLNKRLISLITIIAVLISCLAVAEVYADNSFEEMKMLVGALDIMNGDENGNLNLENFVSRAEFTKIAVAMSEYRNMVATGSSTSMFTDVNFKHWAAPYVRLAVINGIFTGYPDGTFKPDSTVLLEEAVTVMLRLQGYTDADFGNSWPYGQIGIAKGNGILDGVNKTIGNELTRDDILKIAYNTLTSTPKGGNINSKYLEKLDSQYYEDTVIIATNEQNTGVAPGYVQTSNGTFRISDGFDQSLVGSKGSLAVINGNYFGGFAQSDANVEKLVIYSKLDNAIMAYSNGAMVKVDIDGKTTAYQDSEVTTYRNIEASLKTGDTIYIVRNNSNRIEYINVESDSMTDAETVKTSTWYSKYTNDVQGLTVMRDGVKGNVSDVKTNDIVYYLKDINTVFAYSKKVTGVYEKATPNKDMPTSVTISGKEYSIETVEAFNKLSSAGSFNYGDTVTIMLGKNSEIADVMTGASTSVAAAYGFLYATGTKSLENSDGEHYTSSYASIVYADGTTADFVTQKVYTSILNQVVSIKLKDGVATLSPLTSSYISGKVNSDSYQIGTHAVSPTVSVLDVSTNDSTKTAVYKSVYLKRLDGINLSDSNVMYFHKNQRGEIDQLILNNATGDNYIYGVITSSTDKPNKTQGSPYTINVNGTEYRCTLDYGTKFRAGDAVGISVSGNSVNSMISLQSAGNVSDINGDTVTVGGKDYTTSDSLIVYKKTQSAGGTVTNIMPIGEYMDNVNSLYSTAFWDKAPSSGGRVRIIIVR